MCKAIQGQFYKAGLNSRIRIRYQIVSINLTENALTVLKTRYLLAGEEPEDLFRRVAVAVASAEKPNLIRQNGRRDSTQ